MRINGDTLKERDLHFVRAVGWLCAKGGRGCGIWYAPGLFGRFSDRTERGPGTMRGRFQGPGVRSRGVEMGLSQCGTSRRTDESEDARVTAGGLEGMRNGSGGAGNIRIRPGGAAVGPRGGLCRMFLYPAGQLDEVGDGELLGPFREEGMLRAAEVAEDGTQRVADHLAALVERCFHDADKQSFVVIEVCGGIAAQADDGAFDLRGWIENCLVDREKVFDIVPCLQQHREDAVFLRAGAFGDADGHFLLDHAHAFGNEIAVFENLEEYLRGDVVREVADDLQPLGEAFAQVELQEIAFDESRCEGGVVSVEIGDALRIDLGAPGRDVVAL